MPGAWPDGATPDESIITVLHVAKKPDTDSVLASLFCMVTLL